MAEKNSNQETKNTTLTTSSKRRLVKAICKEYHDKLDSKAPTMKRDLNYTQIRTLMYLNDTTKNKFRQLAFEDKIDPRDSLSKWRIEVIAEFKDLFTFDINSEDVEDVQTDISGEYEKWYKENFPESKKRISPKSIKLSELLTYMAVTNKDKPLPNLAQYGVNDFTSWKLSHINMEASKVCRDFLNKKSA